MDNFYCMSEGLPPSPRKMNPTGNSSSLTHLTYLNISLKIVNLICKLSRSSDFQIKHIAMPWSLNDLVSVLNFVFLQKSKGNRFTSP